MLPLHTAITCFQVIALTQVELMFTVQVGPSCCCSAWGLLSLWEVLGGTSVSLRLVAQCWASCRVSTVQVCDSELEKMHVPALLQSASAFNHESDCLWYLCVYLFMWILFDCCPCLAFAPHKVIFASGWIKDNMDFLPLCLIRFNGGLRSLHHQYYFSGHGI